MDANTKEHKQTKSLRLFIIIIIFVNDRKPTLNAHHEFSHKVMKIFFFAAFIKSFSVYSMSLQIVKHNISILANYF